jgi:hypothetical protein
MAELTKEQIERAAEALWNITFEQRESRQPGRTEDRWCNVNPQFKDEWREWARVAAPYLQLPWDEPNEAEIAELGRERMQRVSPRECGFLREFVRRRNAALLPKPVDPRREPLVKMFTELGCIPPCPMPHGIPASEFMADTVLKIIDTASSK